MLVEETFILDELNALIQLPPDEQKIGFGPNQNSFKPILILIADIAEFPKTPWLKIPAERRLTILKGYPNFVRVHFDASPGQLQSLAESRQSQSDVWPEIVAVLRIPLGMSNDEIIGTFTSELKAYIERNTEKLRKLKGGRGLYADRLNELGALRLLEVMDGDSLCSYTSKHLADRTGLYSNKVEFQKAAKKAEAYLNGMIVGH